MEIRNRVKKTAEGLAVVLPPVLLMIMTIGEMPYTAVAGTVVLLLGMLPFFLAFEHRRPGPEDIVPIAVMSVIASLGRMLFAPFAGFKPTSAVVMITGMQFGPQAGFLTGALSALASNMFLGQGPWTPWQMYAWGMIGYIAGICERKGIFRNRVILYGFGMLSGILFGWFLNLWHVSGYVHPVTLPAILAAYAVSFPMDLTHGLSTVVFLAVLHRPWSKKLKRLKLKYGIGKGDDICM